MKEYKALVCCYGNTRSSVLEAATNTHLNRMGSELVLESAGLERMVKGIYERAGTTDVALPEKMIIDASEIDQDYGKNLALARRTIATPEKLNNSDLVLLVDDFLRTQMGNPISTNVLQYAGHKNWKWGYDLDDASPRGCLEVVQARVLEKKSEEEINEGIENGGLLYHAPLGGSYKPGSEEAEHVELRQLFTIGRIIAQKLVEVNR